jgi:5-methylcytosine-specific restriction endonuclease McrA
MIERAYIIMRDGSRCHLCGKKCRPHDIHLDHLVPISRGGSHDESNLRVACAACNVSKQARPMGEQLMLIG